MALSSINNAALTAGLQAAGNLRQASAGGTEGMVYNDLSGLSQLKMQSRENPEEALKEVARQFESVFVTMMMKSMRDTLPKDGMFGSSQMETYQEMFDQQLSLDLAGKGGLGLASLIQRQMSRTIVSDKE